jgi:integrase/recombinase XerC
MHTDPFIVYLKTEKRYSFHTLKAYENDLRQYVDFSDNFSPGDPVPDHRKIRQWVVHLIEKGVSPRTVRRKISVLSSYYRYMIKRGLSVVNPMTKVNLPKWGRPLPGFIPENKLTQLLDEIDFGNDFTARRDRLIIEMLYFTGMRRAELIGLNHSDVDTGKKTIKVHGKGGKERYIPVGPFFCMTLKDYLSCKESQFGRISPEDPFFVTSANRKLYPELVYRVVRKYLGLVTNETKRSPHILRHSFATHMLNNGADLNAIKELLGHANLNATQVYTHNSFEKLKKVYKQAHPRA